MAHPKDLLYSYMTYNNKYWSGWVGKRKFGQGAIEGPK
jgi:hypothetical protein